MRRLLPTDLAWAARYLLLVSPSLRYMVCVSLFDRVHSADKIRKRLGRATQYGNGSLGEYLATQPRPPEPFVNDPDYAHAIQVVSTVILHRITKS